MTAVGDRVELVRLGEPDPYTKLKPGDKGTVRFVDSLGTIHVDWESGSKLGLVPQAGDQWQVIGKPPEPFIDDDGVELVTPEGRLTLEGGARLLGEEVRP